MNKSIHKTKKIWKMVRDQVENYNTDGVPFPYVKDVTITNGNETFNVKNKREFNEAITAMMTKYGLDTENIKIKYLIDYNKLVDKVEKRTEKFFGTSTNK